MKYRGNTGYIYKFESSTEIIGGLRVQPLARSEVRTFSPPEARSLDGIETEIETFELGPDSQ